MVVKWWAAAACGSNLKIVSFHKFSATVRLPVAYWTALMTVHDTPSLNVLRAFHAVAECTNLTQAAAMLSRSQPALTLAMSKLERQVDAALLERRRSGSHLTSAGRILHFRVTRMLEQLERALGEVVADGRPSQPGPLERMTQAQVRLVEAIADNPTIERAAQALGVTQASLRRTGRSLERLLGRTLFDATSSATVPTEAGAEVARKVKLALREIPTALEEIVIEQGRVESRIAIGVVPLCATRILTLAINDFLDIYPRANIAIAHGPYKPLLQDLRDGRIDMLYGVLRLPSSVSDIREEFLFYDPYAIAVRRGHPLTQATQLTLDDLTKFDWVGPPHGTPRRGSIERLFAGCSRKPTVRIETSSLNMQRALLAGSDRITLLTRQEMALEAMIGTLVSLPLDAAISRRNDGVATRKDWRPTSVQSRFMELLRERSAEISGVLRAAE